MNLRQFNFLIATARTLRQDTHYRELFLEKLEKLSEEEVRLIATSQVINPPKVFYNWPLFGETMTSQANLENIIQMCNSIVKRKIEGDIVETGIWRGGSSIMLKKCLDTLEPGHQRKVYACDSFQGCPTPDMFHEKDKGDLNYTWNSALAISRDRVEKNFIRYGCYDNVNLVEGWFCDIMPELRQKIEKIAILRLDGDCYSSTMDVLNNLYDKISKGGFCVIDDFELVNCKLAVDEFRSERGITTPIYQAQAYDGTKAEDGVYGWMVE